MKEFLSGKATPDDIAKAFEARLLALSAASRPGIAAMVDALDREIARKESSLRAAAAMYPEGAFDEPAIVDTIALRRAHDLLSKIEAHPALFRDAFAKLAPKRRRA